MVALTSDHFQSNTFILSKPPRLESLRAVRDYFLDLDRRRPAATTQSLKSLLDKIGPQIERAQNAAFSRSVPRPRTPDNG